MDFIISQAQKVYLDMNLSLCISIRTPIIAFRKFIVNKWFTIILIQINYFSFNFLFLSNLFYYIIILFIY